MIHLQALGRIELRNGEREAFDSIVSRPKRLAILAYLCIAGRGDFVRRDVLLALFWPESDQDRARASLSQSLYVLRQALGADTLPGRGRDDVGVDQARLSCDVLQFRQALAAGDLGRAVDLYEGDLLPGLYVDTPEFDQWLGSERQSLRTEALEAALRLGARSDGQGAAEAAAGWYRRALEVAPESEAAAGGLVDALWRGGRRIAALEEYERFAARLSETYGVEPGARMLDRVARIRAGEPSPVGALVGQGTWPSSVSGEEYGPGPNGAGLARPTQREPPASDASRRPARSTWSRAALPFGLGLVVILLLGMWLERPSAGHGLDRAGAEQGYRQAWAAWESNRLDSARFFLERAVRLDSTHARAWALLGYIDLLLWSSHDAPPGEAFLGARSAAERAIALDSTLAPAWHTHATVLWSEWNWTGAVRAYRHTIGLPAAGTWGALSRADLSALLADLGRCEEAWEVIAPYARLEPIDRTLGSAIAIRIPYLCGEHMKASRLAEEALALGDPSPAVDLDYLFRARLESGDLAAAEETLGRLRSAVPGHPYPRAMEALLLARRGEMAEARAIVDELSCMDPESLFAGFYPSTAEPFAQLRAAVGDVDAAFAILETEMNAKGHVRRLPSHPLFAPLRTDPRYAPLVARMGLRCRMVGDRQSCRPIE